MTATVERTDLAPAKYSGSRGPGTLVTTQLTAPALPRRANWPAIRVPSPISAPGASWDSSVRLRAPIARVISLEPAVERCTAASRSTGSAMSLPRLTIIAETWLPASLRSFSDRTETGVIARIDVAGSSPRPSR
jgi:hypothetical protein